MDRRIVTYEDGIERQITEDESEPSLEEPSPGPTDRARSTSHTEKLDGGEAASNEVERDGRAGGQPENGERSIAERAHSPSEPAPTRVGREETARNERDGKNDPKTSGARRIKTNVRVLPILCDDDQKIDVLDEEVSGENSNEMPERGRFSVAPRKGRSRWDRNNYGAIGSSSVENIASSANKDALSILTSTAPAPPSTSHSMEKSRSWTSRSDEKSRKDQDKNKVVSLFNSLLRCFGAKQNQNKHNANRAQTNGEYDVFLSSASDIPKNKAEAKTRENYIRKDDDVSEQKGSCHDCLFLCRSSEELKDELLRRTYQYRGEIKIYEEKLHKLEENQDSFLKTAQKRYEDLVWGKEDFIYDIKVIDFQMKDLERELTPSSGDDKLYHKR